MPVASHAPPELPFASRAPAQLPVASRAPPQLPVASHAPAQLPVASHAPTQLPVASHAPAQLPVASRAPPQLPVASHAPPQLPVASPAPAQLLFASCAPAQLPVASHAPPELPFASLAPPQLPVASHAPTQLPVASHAPAQLPVASHAPPQLPVASRAPAQLPVASHAPPELPFASRAPAQLPVASHAPPELPFASRAPAQLPVAQVIETHSRSESGREYLDAMKNLAVASLLPKSELTAFDGNSLRYFTFLKGFENNVEKDTLDASRRLQLLIQFCTGKAKRLIENCILLEPEEGYRTAKRLLAERFGDKYKVTKAWICKISDGPAVKPGDREALLDLADDLQSCDITLQATGRLMQINSEDKLVKVIGRCPGFVRSRWQSKVQEIREEGRDPNIADIRRLVRKVAVEKNDPVFGEIMDSDSKNKRSDKKYNKRAGESLERSINQRSMNFNVQTVEKKSTNVESKLKCFFCEKSHKIGDCDTFKKQTGEEQFKFMRSRKLCDNCFSSFHFSAGCKRRNACSVPGCPLKRKHITSLHEPLVAFMQNRGQQNAQECTQQGQSRSNPRRNDKQFVGVASDTGAGCGSKGLTIVPVKVKGQGKDKIISTYALLDNGSTASFCTDDLLKKLEIEGRRCHTSVTTINGVEDRLDSTMADLEVMDIDGNTFIEVPNVFSMTNLNVSADAITRQDDVDRWCYLEDVKLPAVLDDMAVGLLIGVDVPEALEIEEIIRGQNGGPYAVKTKFGWTLNGPMGRISAKGKHCYKLNVSYNDDDLSEQLRQYFNRDFNESIADEQKMMSLEDRRALSVFQESAQIVDGHYQIAIPWRNPEVCLPNNRPMAEHRLRQLRKRLIKDPDMLKKYSNFIDDLSIKGYARKIPEDQINVDSSVIWYLPHHNVIHPQRPDKVRVVFDCAAKYRGESLNEKILQGPDLTNSLVGVLMRFRQEQVALMADVEAMFHQVKVDLHDANALRFLWYPDGDVDKEPEEFQMLVHLFGGIWCPSCATYALRRTALDNAERFPTDVIDTVQRNFYVDDWLKSVKTTEHAVSMCKQVTDLLALGGFHLTKWICNRLEVLDSISSSELSKELHNINFEKDALPVKRALGMQWNVETDKFFYDISIKEKPPTRRGMLSIISSVYDPLGFISPFVLRAKIILQQLCRQKLSWDEEIPEAEHISWKKWLAELPTLTEFTVERCMKPENFGEIVNSQLHHFSDASESGYGAVSYIRMENGDGNIHCSFFIAKSRLTPVKPITIPRLELSAAAVAVRLDRMIRSELDVHVSNSFFWTDSTAVLRYVKNENKRFQTFVANKVAVIHAGSTPKQWFYIDTLQNPADDASRGLNAMQLVNSTRWCRGPEFLWQNMSVWPVDQQDLGEIQEDDPEIKKTVTCHASQLKETKGMTDLLFSRFSDWHRLKKAVVWLLRFKQWLRLKTKSDNINLKFKTQGRISVEEMKLAEETILRCVQNEIYGEEVKTLKSEKMVVNKSSSLRRLDPFLKGDILCVGGRIKHMPSSNEEFKHPAILPKKHHVVDLIIKHYHQQSGHSGVEYVLAEIRQRFWIIKGRVAVRRAIGSCFDCRRRVQPPGQQKMADLPADRITPGQPPFTFVGVDFFGPFMVKKGRSLAKRYGVLYTCLVVRAIHIEVAHSLDTDSFINSLRRFISRRGVPEEIRSDNGTNLKGGNREISEAVRQWNLNQLHEFLLQREIRWHFNPPRASHMGGVWERQIRSVRKVFAAVLKEQTLTDEGLHTLLCEAEAIINGRPLTKLSEDNRDVSVLTPNHLLLLRSNSCFPPGVFSKADSYSKKDGDKFSI